MSDKQKREQSHPGYFSSYRRFWKGTRWQLFLRSGLEASRKDVGIERGVRELQGRPGVYEFALTKGSSDRIKVYVGESGNLRARHGQYLQDGDHLRPLFDAALADGCTVWRRCRYVGSKEGAVQWEAAWLSKYNYAWNQRGNVRKRTISLQQRWCCFCVATGIDIREYDYQSPAKACRPKSPSKPQGSQQKKPAAAKQLQFVVAI